MIENKANLYAVITYAGISFNWLFLKTKNHNDRITTLNRKFLYFGAILAYKKNIQMLSNSVLIMEKILQSEVFRLPLLLSNAVIYL